MEIRESTTRENLINDIQSFLIEAFQIYNDKKIVKRSEYLNLETRICNLKEHNFDSEEKFKQFLKYINQLELKDRRNKLVNYFQKNPIKEGYFNNYDDPFMVVDAYLRTLISWLK